MRSLAWLLQKCLLLCCPATFFCAAAQERMITVRGSVTSDSLQPLGFANITVMAIKAQVHLPLAYTISDKDGKFSINVPLAMEDSILVRAAYSGYSAGEKRIPAQPGANYRLDFNLSVNYTELGNVVVTPPPVWKNGDTTFLNVDAVRNGDERKLEDILQRMPGFRINANGELFYKGQKVRRIRMQGEELFADNPALILKTFPAHVLKTIQVLEKQTENNLLKGMSMDEQVFLNLDLGDESDLKLFGDVDAGLGTRKRFRLNSSAFTLAKKTKAALIATNNGGGSNTRNWNRYGAAGELLPRVASTLPATTVAPYINNLPESRYLDNTTVDNRLQLNTPVSASLKLSTELSYLHDRYSQQSRELLFIYSDNSYLERNVSSDGKSLYKTFRIREILNWNFSKHSNLDLDFFYLTDRSRKEMSSQFIQQDSVYGGRYQIRNNWKTWQVKGTYILKPKEDKAFELAWDYNSLKLPQTIAGSSSDFFRDFDLPDSSYSWLEQPGESTLKSLNLKWTFYAKKQRKRNAYRIYYRYNRLNRISLSKFRSTQAGLPDDIFEEASGTGSYSSREIFSEYSRMIRIFKVPVFIKAELGYASLLSVNRSMRSEKDQFRVNLELKHENQFTRVIKGELEVSYQQTPPDIYKLSTMPFPTGFASFQNYRNIFLSARELSASYKIDFSFRNYSSLFILFNFQRNYSSYVLQPDYGKFSSLLVDSAVRRITDAYNASVTYRFPFLPLGAKVTLSSFTGKYQYLTNGQNGIQRLSFLSSSNALELIRNWKKKSFLNIRYEAVISRNLNVKNAGAGYINQSINSMARAGFRKMFGKGFQGLVNVEWVSNASSGTDRSSGVLPIWN